MKYLLAFLAGIAVLLASGYAYGEDRMAGYAFGGDKMISNDDLQNASPDKDSSTFNQMPMSEGSEGSAPGGLSNDSDSLKKEIDEGKEPIDKTPVEPSKEPERRGPGTDMYMYRPGY